MSTRSAPRPPVGPPTYAPHLVITSSRPHQRSTPRNSRPASSPLSTRSRSGCASTGKNDSAAQRPATTLRTWPGGRPSRARKQSAGQHLKNIQELHENQPRVADSSPTSTSFSTPTVAVPPLPLGSMSGDGGPTNVRRCLAFTALANVTGQPAMSVPLATTDQGLPPGVQFIGRFGDETTLFQLAGQARTCSTLGASTAIAIRIHLSPHAPHVGATDRQEGKGARGRPTRGHRCGCL